jgi:hypothetical protein
MSADRNSSLASVTPLPSLGEVTTESSTSAVSWGAIIAGGVAAAALSLVLLAFGAGAGFSSIFPWSGAGLSTTFKVSVGIYLIVMAVMASSVGGYLAGRLRTRWVGAHTREVFFRDTAHGLLTWAFGTILWLALLASPASALLNGAATALSGHGDEAPGITDEYVDRLVRPSVSGNVSTADLVAWRGEVKRIFAMTIQNGTDLGSADRTYLAQIVSARTGLSTAEAQERVAATISDARTAADKVRKAAAQMSLWLAASMLAGALAASLAAIEGGGLRDGTWHYKV